MPDSPNRRQLLTGASLLGIAAAVPRVGFAEATDWTPAAGAIPALFPTQEATLAKEMVGVSHGNVARVKELLAQHPSLARATWDWGFGDWETALGAASHVGNPEIAELLLSHGARPDIFCAAMLGHLDTVKAFVAARPGCQSIPGPHGITLLSHAKAGGEAAAPVAAWLESIGGADEKPATAPLADAERDALLGTYRFGAADNETIEVAVGKMGLTLERKGTSAIRIVHAGERAFFPAGAPQVRLRFTPGAGAPAELTVHDPDLVLTARRVVA